MSGFRINSVMVAVIVGEDGDEGACAIQTAMDWMPLVAADPKREVFVREQAQILANQTGMKIKLIRLTTREEVEEITSTKLN